MPATTWKVGDITITKVVELETVGRTRFILPQATPEEIQKIAWLHPHFVDDSGRLKMSVHALVVETPTRRIVVDTGIGNDKENRGIPTWNRLDGPFLGDLTVAGYPADTIDTVLCTHLHVDHVGWNTRLVEGRWVPTFRNARYVIGRFEFEYWKNDREDPGRAAVFDDSVKPVADAGLVDLVASDHQVCDELTLIPSPGHSPGHHGVHIKSRGEEALLIGDVLHHPCQMAHPDWASTADSYPAQSTRTRHEMFARFAGTPTLVLGGHFFGGRIVRDGDAYRLDMG